MKAKEITDKVVEEIEKGTDFIFVNFANADMVGHTANKDAIVKAVESTDRELGRIIETAEKNNATVLITADHGNAELNIDQETGEKHTAHTINLVPFIITDKKLKAVDGELSGHSSDDTDHSRSCRTEKHGREETDKIKPVNLTLFSKNSLK